MSTLIPRTTSSFQLKSPLLFVLFSVLIVATQTGCGGDDAFTGESEVGITTPTSPTPVTPPPSQGPSGGGAPANTIALSYSQGSSVEDLGGGIYRRIGKAIVTDTNGHSVADGTIVQLSIIDSVIAEGFIDATDSIAGNTITDLDLTDFIGTPTTFTNAFVERNSAVRYIQPGDHVFLTFAEEEDKDRIVNIGGITGTEISVNALYSRNYPDADYPAGRTGFLIGASLLGAEISGEDLNGDLFSGFAMTKGGIATFYVTYPANVNTILTGCLDPSLDTRSAPTGSAQVFLVASVSSAVTTIDNRFCFTSIAGGSLSATPSSITSSANIVVSYRDGGDGAFLPFVPLTLTVAKPWTSKYCDRALHEQT